MEQQENKQEILDYRYMRMARIWAENSYCKRRQVGALIVKNKMIISDGYNGTPSGFSNNQDSTFEQQQRRSYNVRNYISLYRMCQAHNTGRYKKSGLRREVPS